MTDALSQGLERHFGSRRACVAALLLATLAALFLLSQKLQRCDDAYITFRHARHLAEHLRPAWNLEGPAVLGSTSPAFTLLLGGVARVLGLGRVDELALGLNAALLFAIVILTYLVARDLSGSSAWALPPAALVGFNSVNVFIFSLGFEAALLVVVLLASLYLARQGAATWALLLAGCAPLVRPEGLLISPLVWAALFGTGRYRHRWWLAYLVVPVAWFAFATSYYGSPVPQPIRSRALRPAIFAPWEGGRVDLVARLTRLAPDALDFATGEAGAYLFAGYKFPRNRSSGTWGAGGWVALAGFPALALWAWRRAGLRVVYVLYAPLFILLYAWIGYREAWYYPSFVSFALLAVWQGAALMVTAVGARSARFLGTLGQARLRWALGSLAFALLASDSNYQWNAGEHEHKGPLFARDPRGPLFERHELERFRSYRDAAKLLAREQVRPRAVLTSEVGVFGFFYDGVVIDTVGLCSPEALRFYPLPPADIRQPDGRPWSSANNITPTRMLAELRPAYVVNARGYIRHLEEPGSPLDREYVKIGTLGTAWGEPLLLFRRGDLEGAADPAAGR